jgi:hypothetical protein
LTHVAGAALQLSQRGIETLDDGRLDGTHAATQRLMQLDHVCALAREIMQHLLVEPAEEAV